MMNLTTLPLSFWDYALESATRILNMVSTKKIDKKPYELWYGKVPNLFYLKVWGCEVIGTDKTKITRKPSKPDKHGHEKRKSTKEAGINQSQGQKVNSGQLSVNYWSTKVKPQNDKI
ncbi:hypothetical protein Tco_0090113 [Tanacetum coccineum]